MVNVVRAEGITISVLRERGERHKEPHCHVRWADGECSIGLAKLDVLAGKSPPRRVRELIRAHKAELRQAWDEMNGEEAR